MSDAPLHVTPAAIQVLTRALEMAPHAAGVRVQTVRRLGGGESIEIELAAAALDGELEVDVGAMRLFVDPELIRSMERPVLTVGPEHERLLLLEG